MANYNETILCGNETILYGKMAEIVPFGAIFVAEQSSGVFSALILCNGEPEMHA